MKLALRVPEGPGRQLRCRNAVFKSIGGRQAFTLEPLRGFTAGSLLYVPAVDQTVGPGRNITA